MRSARESAALALLILIGVGYAATLNLTPIYTSDFWVQLAVGDIIRDSGSIPTTILFAFGEAGDANFLAYEWLPSLISSRLYAAIDYPGMVAFKFSLSLAIFALASALYLQVCRNPGIAISIGALCLLGVNGRTQMRPEIYGFIYFLASLNLIHAYVRGGDRRWLLGLIPLMFLWANSHGSFLVGFGLPGIFALGIGIDAFWKARGQVSRVDWKEIGNRGPALIAISLALVITSLANPFGTGLLEHVFTLFQSDYIRENILEWLPVFDAHVRGKPTVMIYVFIAILSLVSLALDLARSNATLWLLLAIFGLLSLSALRHISWFVIVACYALAHVPSRPQSTSPLRLDRLLIPSAGLLLAALYFGYAGNVRGRQIGFDNQAPLGLEAIHFLEQERISGNVFNSYNFGDQLAYQFYPEIRVAIDSRVDAYGETHSRMYRSLSGRSRRELAPPDALLGYLQQNEVNWIVTRPGDFSSWRSGGHEALLIRSGWRQVYDDPKTIVLRR